MLQTFDPRNQDLFLNINGRLLHRDEAGVSPFDSAVQNGDAVWEGLRLYNGCIFKLPAHLDRLRRSAAALKYEGYPGDDVLRSELTRTLEANHMYDGVHVRLTVSRGLKYTSGLDPRINTRGCSYFILAEHKPPVYNREGVSLVTAQHRRPPARVLDQKIHSCNQLTSILAKLEATAAGADDALMLDLEGNLAETNATHVFLVKNGVVRTSTCDACPEGITRQTVLELCEEQGVPHEVAHIPHADVLAADELFVTGTMGELVPVVRVDGRAYPLGPVTRRLTDGFNALVVSESQSTRLMPAKD